MKMMSALLSLFGLGGSKSFEPREYDKSPKSAVEINEPYGSVYRGGKHQTRGLIDCPACWTTTAKSGQCLIRRCSRFNGRLAYTHSDVLSLDRGVRMRALDRWARNGMAGLFSPA